MKPFSLLIKPASADCNLRCNYCFYIDHLDGVDKKPRMSYEVLEKLISSYMQTNQNNNYAYGWQGGEPLLMGLKFFQTVIELQKKFAPSNATISNGLQSNGTLITVPFAKFFNEYNFLLGISLDGPSYIHDYYRKSIGKKPTHSLVMSGIQRLKQSNVEFNILILVNNENVKKSKEIYQYLLKNSFNYQQYIPCVEFDEDDQLTEFSISGEEWGNFLCGLFDIWFNDDKNRISIRFFDSILEYLVNGGYNVCYMGNSCCQYFVVEYDGSVYPCDFYVQPDMKLGNILTDNWDDIIASPIYKKFGQNKSLWNSRCIKCQFLKFCHGDCQKFRRGDKTSTLIISQLCKGWKRFYSYTLPRFNKIATTIKSTFGKNDMNKTKIQKVGRNATCPCGSGKKYKYCCMR